MSFNSNFTVIGEFVVCVISASVDVDSNTN